MMFVRLSSSYFFYFALLGLVSPFLAIFLDGKGFNSRQVGEILAILTATKIIAPSLWALLSDKVGKPLLVIQFGGLLTLISFLFLFWAASFWSISCALALFTLFWTAILPQLEVHSLSTIRGCNKIYARVRLWGSIGFIVLAVLAGEVISSFGYESFTVLGTIILVFLYGSTLGLKAVKQKVTAQQVDISSITDKLINKRFITFFVAGILLQLSFAPYYGFFALFLRDLDYSGLAIGLLISIGVVAEVIAFIYMGKIFKRYSVQALLVFSLFITAIRWLLTPLVADSVGWLSLIQLSHAASFAIYHSACMAFISSYFNKHQQSRGQGIYLGGVYGVGGAIGAYITGILWLDGAGANSAFYVAALSSLLGGLIMLFSTKKVMPSASA